MKRLGKSIGSGLLVMLASGGAQAAGNPCGEPAGSFSDSSAHSAVSRTISRFRQGTQYVYTYELTPQSAMPTHPYPGDGQSFSIRVEFNGKSALTLGHMFCTSMAVDPITDGKCGNQAPSAVYTSAFFQYAANGDHLNAWNGEVSVLNPITAVWENPTPFSFPERKFADLKWQ